MDQHQRQALDAYITGNYGEDQFRDGADEWATTKRIPTMLRSMDRLYAYLNQRIAVYDKRGDEDSADEIEVYQATLDEVRFFLDLITIHGLKPTREE